MRTKFQTLKLYPDIYPSSVDPYSISPRLSALYVGVQIQLPDEGLNNSLVPHEKPDAVGVPGPCGDLFTNPLSFSPYPTLIPDIDTLPNPT
jgi:hypothetical protein